MDTPDDSSVGEATIRCEECHTQLAEGQDRQQTDDAVFCRPCFERLNHEVGQAIAAQGEDINYAMAFVGGVAGGLLGAIVWWGFTVVTSISFGLVAIVIGFAVGKGVTMLSGNKRHLNLQIMAVGISTLAFVYASFLVNRTFLLKAFAEEGLELSLLPSPEMFYKVVITGAGAMDLLFLAIVLYEAWKIPAPLAMAPHS